MENCSYWGNIRESTNPILTINVIYVVCLFVYFVYTLPSSPTGTESSLLHSPDLPFYNHNFTSGSCAKLGPPLLWFLPCPALPQNTWAQRAVALPPSLPHCLFTFWLLGQTAKASLLLWLSWLHLSSPAPTPFKLSLVVGPKGLSCSVRQFISGWPATSGYNKKGKYQMNLCQGFYQCSFSFHVISLSQGKT